MPAFWTQFSEKIRSRLPENRVILVPGDAFFCHLMEIPEAIGRSEVRGFIALALETESPFPLDQLNWGFVLNEKTRRALVYAAPAVRLQRMGLSELDDEHWVIPSFLALPSQPVNQRTIRFIATENTLSAISLDPGSDIPVSVVSRRFPDGFQSDEALKNARRELANSLNGQTQDRFIESDVWLVSAFQVDSGGRMVTHFRRIPAEGVAQEESTTVSPTGEYFWNADVRSQELIRKEKRVRRISGYLWVSILAAIMLVVALVILQGAVWTLRSLTEVRSAEIAQRSPEVTLINNKFDLAERLLQSTETDLHPFRMLEAVNRVRPDSLYFTKADLRSAYELVIDGNAQSADAVNQFSDRIRKLPFVASAEVTPRTRQGQTTFDMSIRFSQLPPPIAAPVFPEAEGSEALEEGPSG